MGSTTSLADARPMGDVRKRKQAGDGTNNIKRCRDGNYEWQGEPIRRTCPLERALSIKNLGLGIAGSISKGVLRQG